jgi:hypothetical protein
MRDMTKTKLTKEEIAKRAEEYDNSRPIDVWRVSDYPEVKSARDHIHSEIKATGKIKPQHANKYRKHVNAVILDLFVANQFDSTRYVGYSRNSNKYKIGSRYKSLFFSYRVTKTVVDFLIAHDYAEGPKGFRRDVKPRQSRLRATDKLINLVENKYKVALPMIKRDENEEIIILRDAAKKDIEYEDTKITIQMRENLKFINRSLERHAVLLYVTDKELQKINERLRGDPTKGAIDFTQKRLRRKFNNCSFKQGGRFYDGWWHNLPREYRKYIRLNDKDIVELDYSGLHINMLYAIEKLPMPEGDVYKLDGYSNDDTFREFVKKLLQAMINAPDRDKARKGLHEDVHRKKELELPLEVGSTKGKDIFPLMDAFAQKHEKISNYFCTGKGIDLQYFDSQMAEKVMLHFAKMSHYPILPVHDSFIIHHGLEKELKEAMEEAFFDLFGVRCKVDLKYNSIVERQREGSGEPEECKLSARELIERISEEGEYGTYFRLLNQHRKYSKKQRSNTPRTADNTA